MINTTNTFNNTMRKYGRQIALRISYDDIILSNEEIRFFKKTFDAEFFRCCMQTINCELKGKYELENKELKVEFGVKMYSDKEYEYINWGRFIVDNESVEYVVESDTTKFNAYDQLLKSHKLYTLKNIEYPITIKQYLKLIADTLEYEMDDTSFVNSERLIDEEKFLMIPDITYRDVLDTIAGVAGGIIIFSNNKLCIQYPKETNIIIDQEAMASFDLSQRWGPVESITLAREPQEDNIVYPEDSTDEMINLRISNNQIMDKQRSEYIVDIYNQVKGISLYPFNVKTSYAIFEPYDKITLVDLDGKEHETMIMKSNITMSSGIVEEISAELPTVTTTDYTKSTSIKKSMRNVQLYVDKQNGEIKAELEDVTSKVDKIPTPEVSSFEPETPLLGQTWIDISQTPALEKVWDGETWVIVGDYTGDLEDLQSQLESLNTSLTMEQGKIETLVKNSTVIINGEEVNTNEAYSMLKQQIDNFQFTISETGGINKLLNSVGENGTYAWEDVTGSIASTTNIDIRENTLSGNAFLINSGSMKQSFRTIPGKSYTISCKIKKFTNQCSLSIDLSDENQVYLFNLDNEYIDEWIPFSMPIVATGSDVIIHIWSEKEYLIISDLMVNDGPVMQQWTNHQNEIYTSNVKIDKEGIEISQDQTNNKTVINTNEFAGYKNTSKVFSLNGDTTEVNRLAAKSDAQIGVGYIYSRTNGIDITIVKG